MKLFCFVWQRARTMRQKTWILPFVLRYWTQDSMSMAMSTVIVFQKTFGQTTRSVVSKPLWPRVEVWGITHIQSSGSEAFAGTHSEPETFFYKSVTLCVNEASVETKQRALSEI